MDKRFQLIQLFVILSLCSISHQDQSCSGFLSTGYTSPVGDILIEYNTSTPLEITCVIKNKQNPNISSKLYFTKDDVVVGSDKITILNETSIILIDKQADLEAKSSFYRCKLNDMVICLNNVCIGTKPSQIIDFKCLGYNYDNLTCSWTRPENCALTNYSLSYSFPSTRPGKRIHNCNIITDEKTSTSKCFWDLVTEPHYRQTQDVYNFSLTSVNKFGTVEQIFVFDHMKNILSGPPENLTCLNSTVSSLLLYWKIPHRIVPISSGLEHRVLYMCTYGPKTWQHGGLIETKTDVRFVKYNLTGLKHAHDICDIRVAIRVKGAESEDMWSANSSLTVYTSSTKPGAPPKTNVGSFQTDITSGYRNIYVYWQKIPIEIRNGENLQYIVNTSTNTMSSVSTSSYVKFQNMSLNTAYTFIISSKNSEGYTEESAVLNVPANNRLIREPTSFIKTGYGNGLYKLSWDKPKTGAEYIENYTLFWCDSVKDRPDQCAGFLNWTEIPSNATEYNITVSEENTTQFAISANNATSSSGMVWTSCTLLHNQALTKIKELWIANYESTSIEVKWKLDCADRSDRVAGYVIYYCQLVDELCQEEKNVTITNGRAESGKVNGLSPYKTYRLYVSALSAQGAQSPKSDALLARTREGPPEEPYDLHVTNVTNSTITITWEPPINCNGLLRRYEISLNDTIKSTPGIETTFTLDYLPENTTYKISIKACTTQLCSNNSDSILARTKIGHPGRVINTWTARENNTLTLHWANPDEKKKHHLYEIRLRYNDNDRNVSVPTVNVTENSYKLMNCEQDSKKYYVSIRAVNNVTNQTGSWSEQFTASCDEIQHDPFIIIVVIIIIALLAFVSLMFLGRRLYIYFNNMKTIDVKMPAGLDPQIDTNWTQPKSNLNLSDHEHLLRKNFINCGDSSGCSSGQESVNSDSGSSITSNSDSGTEQPKTSSGDEPKELLMNIDSLKSDTPPYVEFPWSNGSSDNHGYSVYGVTDTDTSEIELQPVEDSPYMACDQIVNVEPRSNNNNNNAYVPLNTAQDKNPPYVMAANKNMVLANLFGHVPNAVVEAPVEKGYVQVADVHGLLENNRDTDDCSPVTSDD